MTNAEKFTEVFGFEPSTRCCPREVCKVSVDLEDLLNKYPVKLDCDNCICDFWNGEYKGDEKSKNPIKKFGYWKKGDYWSHGCGMGETYGYYYECSECGNVVQGDYDECGEKFCSKCGAEMRG